MILSFHKYCCGGGPRVKDVIRDLATAGIRARRAHSVYFGHAAVEVLTEDKRKLARAHRIVFG